ncbi:MAG: hypothetical protein K8R59_04715 [Thermoanaerobaculales bacterium]|nr:hypothetical protein [Thermoanaerobaculales bacterium]
MSTPTPPPYDPPPQQYAAPGLSKDAALQKVKAPAVSLMIVAGITFVMQIFSIFASVLGISLMGAGDMSQFEGMEGMEWLAPMMSGTFSVISGIVVLAIAALIFFGAMKMKALESYGLAMTAAILSIIPCFSICCVGIPFGIWALVVLLNKEVKPAFG